MVENPYLKRVFDLIGANKKNEQKNVDSSNLLQKPLTTRRLFTSQQPQIPSQATVQESSKSFDLGEYYKGQLSKANKVMMGIMSSDAQNQENQETKKPSNFGEYYKSQLSKAKKVGKEMVKEIAKAPFEIAKSLYYAPSSMKQGLQGTYQGEPEWKIPLLGNITSYQEEARKKKEYLVRQGFDNETATAATILGVGIDAIGDIAMVGSWIDAGAKAVAKGYTPELKDKISAWKLLGEPKTTKELSRNYQVRAFQFAPDLGGDEEAAKMINQAYTILKKGGLPTAADFAKIKAGKVAQKLVSPLSKLLEVPTPQTSLPFKQLPSRAGYTPTQPYQPYTQPAIGLSIKSEPMEPIKSITRELQPLAEQAKSVNTLDELKNLIKTTGNETQIVKSLKDAGFKDLTEFWNKIKPKEVKSLQIKSEPATNQSYFVTKQPITLYKGLGDNVNINMFAWGEHFADNPQLASQFGKTIIKEQIPTNTKIANLDIIKEQYRNNQIIADPKKITQDLIDKGFEWAVTTMPDGQKEYIHLTGVKAGWNSAGDWLPGEPIQWIGGETPETAKFVIADEVNINNEPTGKYVLYTGNGQQIGTFNTLADATEKAESLLKAEAKEITPETPKETKPEIKPAIEKTKPTIGTEITTPTELTTPSEIQSITPPEIKEVAELSDADLTKRLTSVLKNAKVLRGLQREIVSEGRSQQFAKMMKARETTEGEAGFFAELGALKGEFDKIDFEPVRQSLTQPVIDRLYEMINKTRLLDEFGKLNAKKGLYKILEGKVPYPSEIELLDKVYGDSFTKALLEKRPLIQKIKDAGLQLYNLPRSFMAGVFDFSATFTQNLLLTYRFPGTTAKNFAKSVQSFLKETNFEKLQESIQYEPLFDKMVEAKLPLMELGSSVSARPETFMASWAEKIPLIGKYAIRPTGRAYTAMMNKMMVDTFNYFYKSAEKAGVNVESKEFLRNLGRLIGDLAGRGSLGGAARAIPALSQGLFSARRLAATFDLLNPKFYVTMGPFLRKKTLEVWLSFFGGGLLLTGIAKLLGAEVGDQPASSDYRKIIVDNTRINVWGQFQSMRVLLARLFQQKIISSTTGKEMELGKAGSTTNSLDIISRFFEMKLHPTLTYVLGMMRGTTELGGKFDWDAELLKRFTPMVVQDAYDLFKEHGATGLPFFGTILAALGVPVQTYRPEIQYTEPILEEIKRLRTNEELKEVVGYGAYIPGYPSLSLKENDIMQREAEKIANDKISVLIKTPEYRALTDKKKANAINNETKKAIKQAKANAIINKIQGLPMEELTKTLVKFQKEGLLTKEIYDIIKKRDPRVMNIPELGYEESYTKQIEGGGRLFRGQSNTQQIKSSGRLFK